MTIRTGRSIGMERHAIVMNMKPGMQDEYKKRHDELWESMTRLLEQTGFKNYSIWNTGDLLFQYYEIEDYERALKILEGSSTKKKWDAYMEDIIDEAHAIEMDEMFYFGGDI
jgi:L-rhamnose mutarotase